MQHDGKSPLYIHAADALCRARALPVRSADRNDLRQLAIGLRWLDRNGSGAAQDRVTAYFARPDDRPTAE